MERIDYILISFQLQQLAVNADIDPGFLTDHSILSLTIKYDDPLDRGKGRWMLNNSLLEDINYQTEVRQIFQEITLQANDPIIRWEVIKVMVRGHTIKYATRKKKSRNLTLLALEKNLKDIQCRQSESV